MNFTFTGLPALVVLVGFVVVFSAPVWLAAKLVGAKHPTLLRAILSLVAGSIGAFILVVLTGPWEFILAPLVFLLSFKYILGTSFLGSILLAIVAGLGYAAMGHFMGGGSFDGTGTGVYV